MEAKGIQWCLVKEFDETMIMVGRFHIAFSYLAIIGKIFVDSELADLLIDSTPQ